MTEKQRWWQTEWFWGGVAPLLPAGVLAVTAIVGIDIRSAPWLILLATVPVGLFILMALGMLSREFILDLRTDEKARRVLLLVGAGALAFALLAVGASADDCVWQSEDGSQIEPIHLNDYTFAFQPSREHGTLCLTLRSPEGTVIACDNGAEFPLAYGRADDTSDMHTIVLGAEVYRPQCSDK